MEDIVINGQTYSGLTSIEVERADGTGNISLFEASSENKGIPISLPSVFPASVPKLYKNGENIIADVSIDDYIYSTKLYVDRDNGSDTTGNGTSANPYKTIRKVLSLISADTTIYVKSTTPFMRDEHFSVALFPPNYNVSFVNNNANKAPILLTTAQKGLAWVADENVWTTSRSLTLGVLHKDDNDYMFGWRNLKQVSSLAECKAEAGTFFISGSSVSVHTFDGNVPTETNYLVVILNGDNIFYLNKDKKVAFDGFCWICGATMDSVLFSVSGSASGNTCQSHVALFNCIAGQNDGKNDGTQKLGNGFAFEGIKEAIIVNCIAKNVRRDGFNYHYASVTSIPSDAFVFEYNCYATNCGLKDSSTNNNGSTIHEGGKIVRVNTKASNTKGPLVADVNGSKSFCINCCADDYASTRVYGGFVFLLENTGVAYLIDCSANRAMTASDGTVYLCNYNGVIYNGSTATFVDI